MSNSLKQSMKQRLKSVAKERDLTFDEIWHNLILERFLILKWLNFRLLLIAKRWKRVAPHVSVGYG